MPDLGRRRGRVREKKDLLRRRGENITRGSRKRKKDEREEGA